MELISSKHLGLKLWEGSFHCSATEFSGKLHPRVHGLAVAYAALHNVHVCACGGSACSSDSGTWRRTSLFLNTRKFLLL